MSLEFLLATAIGVLTASGIYLVLRARTFPVVVGLTLVSYAVNLFIFSMGRLVRAAAPIVADGKAIYADPLPQALVLTAIVISFGMTGFVVELAVRARVETGTDHVDGIEPRGHGESER
ncbi:MAG: Na+/H+ antiporter subunit C [Burkholderiales bacterium]|jgi:multicomponent K+:H+ antiporter subunit C|nr:Na+/H+ antiporter subunit C [Burkholderiales bacterium]